MYFFVFSILTTMQQQQYCTKFLRMFFNYSIRDLSIEPRLDFLKIPYSCIYLFQLWCSIISNFKTIKDNTFFEEFILAIYKSITSQF